MSDAIKALRDYLSKSPSVVYPQDVLEYLPAIEAENAKLLELVKDMACEYECCYLTLPQWLVDRMHELGVGVD